VASAAKMQQAVEQWLAEQIAIRAADILDGGVTPENYKERRAYRQALKDVMGALPKIAKKVEE